MIDLSSVSIGLQNQQHVMMNAALKQI